MDFIISGYGAKPQPTLALYHYKKDKPVEIKWQDTIESPSFVCQGDGYLFTITEADDYAKVYVYEKDKNGYRLSDQREIDGGALCHITYSGKNKALFGACYGTGTIFSVRVSEGKFGELLYYEKQFGETPETLTRAHCVLLNKEENELIVNNIALDKIFFYDISDGCLLHKQEVTLPTGSGPRHAILSQDESFLYIITEYSNEIFVYRNDREKRLIQKISVLAEDYSGISYCSTMCFSKNGRYLYAANRGADTFTLFSVSNEGTLDRMKEFDCGGKYPRHMIVTSDGDYLIVCNQNSDEAAVFELDQETGYLKSKAASIKFTAPSGVLEVNENFYL